MHCQMWCFKITNFYSKTEINDHKTFMLLMAPKLFIDSKAFETLNAIHFSTFSETLLKVTKYLVEM